MEVMLMMLPGLPAATSRFAASLATRQQPVKLVSSTRDQASSASCSDKSLLATPALQITTSTVPYCVSAASNAAPMVVASVTSSAATAASPPSLLIESASDCSGSTRRPLRMTCAPACAKTRLNLCPSPPAAPVTSATRP